MPNTPIPHIAILLSSSEDWGRQIMQGVISYANEVGPWHIWIDTNTKKNATELPEGWQGDGIIGRIVSPKLIKQIKKKAIPVVNVSDEPYLNFSSPCVRTDDRAGATLAIEHLLDRGFKKFAFVGPDHHNPKWYYQTYFEQVTEKGYSCEEYTLPTLHPTDLENLSKWLNSLPKPVGIFAWGNSVGRAVVDCCMQARVSVPHDISVVSGSYDALFSHACFPSLSGIRAPTYEIGYHSAKLLHAMMQGEAVPHKTTYLPPSDVVERMSTNSLAINDPQLTKIAHYLRDHALKPITVKDVLKAVPMGRRSLERRFKEAFGRTPLEEIRRIRMAKARSLLSETDLPMQQIAEHCGYANYNYLSYIFKQTTGKTPREYRKQSQRH